MMAIIKGESVYADEILSKSNEAKRLKKPYRHYLKFLLITFWRG